MKLPRRIADILKKKQAFIDSQRDKLESTVIRLQSRLFDDILSELLPELDIKDGVIQDTAKNYRLMSVLDKTYKDFTVYSNSVVLGQIVKGTAKIAELSENYFQIIMSGNLPERFAKVIENADKLINLQIGLTGDKVFKGGWLDSFFNSDTIGMELKEMTAKAVTSNMDKKEYIKLLRNKITGTNQYTGALERKFNAYAYDLYQMYDAAYNMAIGNEFGYKYFVYQGGLIADSRDFCAAHNNKVWSREEMDKFGSWVPADGEYPPGYEIKAKDINAVPSYLSYPGYDPGLNRGGPRCRHAYGWIPDDIAFDMRPDLKEKREEIIKQSKEDNTEDVGGENQELSFDNKVNNAESITELNKIASETFGIEKIDHQITDVGIYKDVLLELNRLTETSKTPAFKILEKEYRHSAYASANNGGMYFNKAFFNNKTKFIESLNKSVNSKYHPIGCNTIKSVIDHEFGHLLSFNDLLSTGWGREQSIIHKELKLLKTKYTKDINSKIKDITGMINNTFSKNPSTLRAASYETEMKYLQTFNKDLLLNKLTDAGATTDELSRIKEAIKNFESTYISGYARRNIDEFVAEGFSSAINNPDASPYAKKIYEILNKYYKR